MDKMNMENLINCIRTLPLRWVSFVLITLQVQTITLFRHPQENRRNAIRPTQFNFLRGAAAPNANKFNLLRTGNVDILSDEFHW